MTTYNISTFKISCLNMACSSFQRTHSSSRLSPTSTLSEPSGSSFLQFSVTYYPHMFFLSSASVASSIQLNHHPRPTRFLLLLLGPVAILVCNFRTSTHSGPSPTPAQTEESYKSHTTRMPEYLSKVRPQGGTI